MGGESKSNGRLAGKVALVTGAASNPGIGRSIALTLAAEGARLIVTDIDLEGAQDCAKQIAKAGGEALALQQDVTSEADWETTMVKTNERFDRLDVLVNNAGIVSILPMVDTSLAQWQQIVNVNLTGVFLGSKHGALAMRQHNGGSLINMSSVAGIIGIKDCAAYCASKGGVRLMSKAIAVEEAAHNIRCNTIHPGLIWTNMQAQATGLSDPEGLDISRDQIPLGRHGEPRDIANMALFLASDESSYITGAEFVVDAGMTAI